MRYLFDLGLVEFKLARCSASLKCAAVMYLIRRLLRLHCQCTQEARQSCHTHNLTPWSESLTKFTGHGETMALRKVAYFYGLLLIEAQFFHNEITPGLMTGCSSPYRVGTSLFILNVTFFFLSLPKKAAFKKFSSSNCLRVATHPMLHHFTTSDIADLDLA